MTNQQQQYFERLHSELRLIYTSILFTPREAYYLYGQAVFRAHAENLITSTHRNALELLNKRYYKAFTGNNPYDVLDRA